jgi:ribose transport system substrate-binding protein
MIAKAKKATRLTARRHLLKLGGGAAALAATAPLFQPAVARAARRYSIAMVPKALDILVFTYGHYGALQRAKELGDVDIIWSGPTNEDANKQAQILDDLISRHVDAIAVTAAAPQPLIAPINRAVDQGIIVTAWDSDVPGSKRLLYYGVNNDKVGQTLGELIVKAIGHSGLVVLESGGPGDTDQNARLKAATDVFKQYPGIKTVGPFFNYDDLLKAQDMTDNLLLAHPDAAALLMTAGTPLFGKMSGMPQLIKNAGRVKVFATDCAPTQMPFVKMGYVEALVGQDYWGWGYQSVSIIHNLLTNKNCKYPEFVPQAMPVITAANVDTWIDRWNKATSVEGAARVFKEAPIGCL